MLNLISEQYKLGLNPTIASIGSRSAGEKPLETEALKRGFAVKKIRMMPGPNLPGAFKLLEFAFSAGFKILHSHGYKGNILFGFIPKSKRRLPLVTTLHGWTSTHRLSKLMLYEWLDACSLSRIDAVVLVSKEMRFHSKIAKNNALNIHVINNGIAEPKDLAELPLNDEIINFCTGGYTVGSIGRLSSEKGYTRLIEAIRILVSRFEDIRLIIIGEGPQRKILERKISKIGLQNRVLLPGYQVHAKRYLPFLKTFLLTSLTEGMPITILEAMQAEVPILATRVGSIPDLLENGKAGYLLSSHSAEEIATKICEVRNYPVQTQIAVKRAKDIVYLKYSARRMAKDYLKVYLELL